MIAARSMRYWREVRSFFVEMTEEMQTQTNNKRRKDRYNKEGITTAHDHLLKLLVAYGEKDIIRPCYTSTLLKSNGEPAFRKRNYGYVNSKLGQIQTSAKSNNWVEPDFNPTLIYGTFIDNEFIRTLFEHSMAPKSPPRNKVVGTSTKSNESVDMSFHNDDGEVEDMRMSFNKQMMVSSRVRNKFKFTRATPAAELLRFYKKSGYHQAHFTAQQHKNPCNLIFYRGTGKATDDGRANSGFLHVFAGPFLSVQDYEQVEMKLNHDHDSFGLPGSHILTYTYPAVSGVLVSNRKEHLANISVNEQESNAGNAHFNSASMFKNREKAYENVLKGARKSDMISTNIILPIEQSTGFPQLAHNMYWQGPDHVQFSMNDTSYLKKSPVEYKYADKNIYGNDVEKSALFGYWEMPVVDDENSLKIKDAPKSTGWDEKQREDAIKKMMGVNDGSS